MPPHSFRLEKSSGFCHPASIPTRPSLLGYHNWRQISGVLDGQMALYGIADLQLAGLDIEMAYDLARVLSWLSRSYPSIANAWKLRSTPAAGTYSCPASR